MPTACDRNVLHYSTLGYLQKTSEYMDRRFKVAAKSRQHDAEFS